MRTNLSEEGGGTDDAIGDAFGAEKHSLGTDRKVGVRVVQISCAPHHRRAPSVIHGSTP